MSDEDEDDSEEEVRAENLEELTGEIMALMPWPEDRARAAADEFLEQVGESYYEYQAGLDMVRLLVEHEARGAKGAKAKKRRVK